LEISVVLPTKNRSKDLLNAVASIIAQSRPPKELILVDQSDTDGSREPVCEMAAKAEQGISLIYLYAPRICGLVDAKRVGTLHSVGDVVCFLEDDVILEPDFLEQIEQSFTDQPEMMGCCGIISNLPPQPFGYRLMFHIFHRGIYRDIRVGIYGRFNGRGHALIASEVLSGGLSAWRREVFSAVPFDVANGFHMYEDIDFSSRVARHFGPRLYINPNARLEHHWSPVNREVMGPRQRRKLTECIVYYKKRRDWPGSTFALPWLLLGMFLEAVFQSCSARSLGPLQGYFLGLRDGFGKKIVSVVP
jgi:glycosyltransferase involved in cell wall biosynthesis